MLNASILCAIEGVAAPLRQLTWPRRFVYPQEYILKHDNIEHKSTTVRNRVAEKSSGAQI